MRPLGSPDAASFTRRNFLSQAGKAAATFGIIVKGMKSVFAQQGGRGDAANNTDMMITGPIQMQHPPAEFASRRTRAVVIGIDHFHAISAPDYIRLLKSQSDVDLVGLQAPNLAYTTKYATMYNTTPFTDYREMVEKTKPDFVIALGKHVEVPEKFRYLVSANVPFLFEKSWATDEKTVNELADLAEAKKAWVCLPTPLRYSWFTERARAMKKSGELGDFSNFVVRFNNPGIQKYYDLDNQWVLNKKEAGGGAILNEGIHGFDLARYILGEEPTIVSAEISNAKFRLEIEDYALITMKTPSGIVVVNEAGYTNTGTEQHSATQKANLATTGVGSATVTITMDGKRPEVVHAPDGYLTSWAGCVRDCLNRLYRGEGPNANARDGARAMSLGFEAYRIAGMSCMKPPLKT